MHNDMIDTMNSYNEKNETKFVVIITVIDICPIPGIV